MKTSSRNLLLLGVLTTATMANADEATIKLYKAQCATCHGLDGRGQTTAGKKVGVKDWSDPKTLKAKSDAEIEQAIRIGKTESDKELMPSFAKLGDAKIKALVGYIRGFQK